MRRSRYDHAPHPVNDWLVRAAVVCAYLLAFLLGGGMNLAFLVACVVLASMLIWEAVGIMLNEYAGWNLRVTLSQLAQGNATFGLVLLLGIYLGVGAVTFHVLERTGLTK